MKKAKTTREFLKYEFTHDEIHDKGLELARLTSEQAAIDNERKAVASEFKAKLDGIAASMETIGKHINNGYEHRYIDCDVIFHKPNTGMKTVYRKDTGEEVRRENMSEEEMQLELEFAEMA